MMPLEIAPKIYDVGVVDWAVRDFHGYKTERGASYNSYLIMDEKICLIDTVKATTPAWFVELRKLAYTLDRRRADILAYFDHPRTSNGPTEAINGRLEHLRGSALGFRNLTNYIARSLLEAGGFRPYLHSQMR